MKGMMEQKAIQNDTDYTMGNDIFGDIFEKWKQPIKLISASDLSKQNLPPIKYAVENLIPEGEIVLSAPYKSGKSWLVMQMCIAVAKGEKFLGFNTCKGSTVYLALEDCDKFAQERLKMITDDVPDNFYYVFESKTLDNGLLDDLEQISVDIPDLRLVVIDTLRYVEYTAKRGESAYNHDYRTGSALKKWADSKGISVVVLTHTTKMLHPDDVFANTTGTNGVIAPADAILTIAKENRTDETATLAFTGRRIREGFYTIAMNKNCVWENLGAITDSRNVKKENTKLQEFKNSEISKAILELCNKCDGKWTGRASKLKQDAENEGIYIIETPKQIGGFINNYANYFSKIANIRVKIVANGSGSKSYVFEKLD